MKIRKTAIAGVALAASLAFLAGCKTDSTTPSAASGGASNAPAATPAQELAAAAAKLGTSTFKYTVSVSTIDLNGQADPANKSVKLAFAMPQDGAQFAMDFIAVGTDYYVKISGLPLPGIDSSKWYHIDSTKVKSLDSFGISDMNDPVGMIAFASMVKNVEKTGTGTFKGTFDFSKPASGFTEKDISELGEKAKNIPFEASVDGQGRLTSFKFTVPPFGSEKTETPVTMNVTDYGTAVTISKPAAGEIVEAPAGVYEMLNA